MDRSEPKSPIKRSGRQPLALRDNGKRPQDIKKQQPQAPMRMSARSEEIQHFQEQAVCKDRSTEDRQQFPSPTSNTCSKEKPPADLEPHRKRKRSQEPTPQSRSEEVEQLFSQEISPKSLDKQEKRRRIGEQRQSPGPRRRSRRLQEIQRQQTKLKSRQINTPPSTSAGNCQGHDYPRDPTVFEKSSGSNQLRKQLQEAEDPILYVSAEPPQKRSRTTLASSTVGDISRQEAANNVGDNNIDPVNHWAQEGSWPKEYFEQDSQNKKGLEQYTCLKDYLIEQEIGMAHLLARKKSSASLRRKDSESSLATPSDQQPREAKSSKYTTAAYETVLATKGSYMGRAPFKITDTSRTLSRSLLITEQTGPQETLFRDDLFDETCDSVRGRNEAMVVRHISPLICPSPLVLQIYGAKGLDCLTESVNEGWNSAIPIVYSRPQPDYSVGFARSAFTNEQLEKLKPLVGDIEDLYTSYFMGTWRMYFPFLTCEVKCGAAALDVADRQNAHSMTIAVRAVVQLYRHVKREKEIHLEILAFSISHDDQAVRIYGHYPVIDEDKTTYYRHPIHEFYFSALEGKEKWTAYKFTKNVYDVWMPTHLKRICSAIDDIPPDLDFGVSLGDSFTSAASADESELPDSQEIATSAPASQDREFKTPDLPRAKKQRMKATLMQQQEIERLRQERVQEREQREQEIERLRQERVQEREQREQEMNGLKEQIKELMDMLKQRLS